MTDNKKKFLEILTAVTGGYLIGHNRKQVIYKKHRGLITGSVVFMVKFVLWFYAIAFAVLIAGLAWMCWMVKKLIKKGIEIYKARRAA